MKVTLNGEPADIQQRTLNQLMTSLFPGCDVAVIDGKEAKGHVVLREKMVIYIGKSPSGKGNLAEAITARNCPGTYEALKDATVGIAGAGGLGSNIATMLIRAGVGRIIVADFDRVEISNLNRQNYSVDDLGHYKVDALEQVLLGINPAADVKTSKEKLNEKNIPRIFSGCDIVCEALDSAESKAMFLDTVSEKLPDVPVICGSGMAGLSDPSDMSTRRLSDRIIVCGDGVTSEDIGLMSARVTICAGLMANMALQLLTQ